MRLLILGGTTEASALARALAERPDVAAVLSLAGRTAHPVPPPIPFRVGGFGGAAGLTAYLRAERIDAVVDATHPFAARISANAAAACDETGVLLAIFSRPPWHPQPGDRWRGVPDLADAAQALGHEPRRAFLTSGRLGLVAFKAAPQHRYLLRSVDPPPDTDRPPNCEVILARGPFDVEQEMALMRWHDIEVVVSKNSGGNDAKLAAARALGIEVVMVERPTRPEGTVFVELDDVLRWIEGLRLRAE